MNETTYDRFQKPKNFRFSLRLLFIILMLVGVVAGLVRRTFLQSRAIERLSNQIEQHLLSIRQGDPTPVLPAGSAVTDLSWYTRSATPLGSNGFDFKIIWRVDQTSSDGASVKYVRLDITGGRVPLIQIRDYGEVHNAVVLAELTRFLKQRFDIEPTVKRLHDSIPHPSQENVRSTIEPSLKTQE